MRSFIRLSIYLYPSFQPFQFLFPSIKNIYIYHPIYTYVFIPLPCAKTQTVASLNGFTVNDSDQSESKLSTFQPASSTAKARVGVSVKKNNITEAEKKARWPTVEELPTVKPSDKEVIKIAMDRKIKDQGEMPLGI